METASHITHRKTQDESEVKFQFMITLEAFNKMVENSVKDKNNKPLRYLTGDFIKIFDTNVSIYEGKQIELQKRNNCLYEETARNNTCYLRINAECKCCHKNSRVKYIFVVKNKPNGDEELVLINAIIKGNHTGQTTKNQSDSEQLDTTSQSLNTSIDQTPKSNRSITNGKRKRILASRLVNMAKKNRTTTPKLLNDKNNVSSLSNDESNSDVTMLLNKISTKIMLKLDQINLKVNQINDRLFELERRFEMLEE